MKLGRIALIAAAGLAVAAFAGVFQPSGARGQAADTASGGITVLGTGSVNITPDRASFAFGTVSQAKTASADLAASSQAATRVVNAMRQAGVARADIQTSEVSLSPRMNENGEEIVGYTATNTVTANIRRIAAAGDVIDAAVGAGANQVYGPNLLSSDQDASYRNALKAAVAEARTKAEMLASAAGKTLGQITAISEGGAGPQPLPVAGAKDAATQIEPGTQRIEATVSVTFAFG
ncbi:SIMPL domain-containing protein [soil metagenome]